MLIVVKMGGNLIKEGLPPALAQDIRKNLEKRRVLLVHGGGIAVTEVASKMGKRQRFVVSPGGFRSRYTDKETAEIFTMVMAGRVNKGIVASLGSLEIPALGLSGADGSLVRAERKKRLIIVDERGRRRAIEGGYTGKITQVNAGLLSLLLEKGYVPVIAPIALGAEFELLNVDGDRMAAHVAGALNAERLVLLTDVEGVTLDGEVVPELRAEEAREKLGKIGPGMITKIYAAVEALDMGIGEVVIAPGFGERPVTSALEHRAGTVISRG
jgi:acetylglutamate/LysW-gamma-L-alpha-aminoadipate kinase